MDAAGVSNVVCESLQNYSQINYGDWADHSIPLGVSAAYTKLALVRDLGMITNDVFDACTNRRWEISNSTESGFTTYVGEISGASWLDSPRQAFSEVSARGIYYILSSEGSISTSSGSPRAAEVELRVRAADIGTPGDELSFPRGLYNVEEIVNPFSAFQLPTPPYFGLPAYYMIREKDNPLGRLSTYQIAGWIHVAEARRDYLRANIQMYLGYRPGAPFVGVPDSWDPPLYIHAIWDQSE